MLVTRQPLVVEELENDPRFAREAAESTGFVPKGIMAVPLLHEDNALGVLEVLDRPANAAFSLAEMELLGLFANEAAIALDLLQKARAARAVLESEGGEAEAVARFVSLLADAEPERKGSGAAAAARSRRTSCGNAKREPLGSLLERLD